MPRQSPKKRTLTAQEMQWASRLKSIFERVKAEKNISQSTLGEAMGISQGAVGQYLNGTIPLNLEAKINFAMCLGCAVSDIDPDAINTFFNPEELRLISAYRHADQSKKDTILGVAELALGYPPKQKHSP